MDIHELYARLSDQAQDLQFLENENVDIELEANRFVQLFARENGLVAHTLGVLTWYFQSEQGLVESGLIELSSQMNPISHKRRYRFEFVDISGIDMRKHA